MSSQSPTTTQQQEQGLEYKDRGNELFGQRKFQEAADAYRQGLAVAGTPVHDELAVALRSNLAITLIKLEEFDEAELQCTLILESHPPITKGMLAPPVR